MHYNEWKVNLLLYTLLVCCIYASFSTPVPAGIHFCDQINCDNKTNLHSLNHFIEDSSGEVLHLRSRGRYLKSHRRQCIVSLSKRF